MLLSVLFIVSCSQPQPNPNEPQPQPGNPEPEPDNPENPDTPTAPEEDVPGIGDGDEPGADLPDTPSNPSACADDTAAANSVYISPSGNDNADGRSPGTAWQSLEKLNAELSSLAAGSQILLERGGVYAGSLNFDNLQASAAAPYTLGAYCEGNAPALSAFEPLSDWQKVTGNIWETTCDICDEPKLLRLNGELQALGRYPNADAEEDGYLLYEAFAGRTSLTASELNGTDWAGASAVVRTRPWVLDSIEVASSSGNTLNLMEGSSYDFWEGGGFFMQNHPATLDQNGEWLYDEASKTIQLYLDSDPNDSLVQTSKTANLLSLNDSRHISFENIRLEGATDASVAGADCSDIRFSNVSVQDSGQGVILEECQNVVFENSTLSSTLDNGLDLRSCENCKVTGSLLKNIAVFPGMGKNGNYHYIALQLGGRGSLVEYSEINGVGHVPVIANSFSKVRYNKILNYHLAKIDGAGVYTYASNDVEIHNNIIANGLGSNAAIPWNTTVTNGIYIDQRSRNVRAYDNTLAYTTGSGIKLHSAQNNLVENNTVFATQEAGLELIEYIQPGELLNNTVRNNQFVLSGADTYLISAPTPNEAGFFEALGTLSDNTYCAPLERSSIYQPYIGSAPAQHYSSLDTWQALYEQDLGSSLCNVSYAPYTNAKAQSDNLIANSSFDTNAETWTGDDANANVQDGRLRLSTGDLGGVVYTAVGELEADKLYRLSFEAASEEAAADLRLRFINTEPDELSALSPIKLLSLSEDSNSFEVFLQPRTSEAANLGFYLTQRDGALFLDNVVLEEVSAEKTAFEDKVKLFANPSKTAESFSLDANYVDANGERYSGSVRVAPYESVVLFKDE